MRTKLRVLATSSASVLALGVLLWSLSEAVFWSAPRPDVSVASALGGVAAYSGVGVLLDRLVQWARVRRVAAVVVAGAAYGWVVEGVVATTLYGDAEIPFPATVAWTALAWHMPVAVLGGWWLLGRLLARRRARTVTRAGVIAGTCWGGWAAGWGPAAASHAAFLLLALVVTVLVTAAHLVLEVVPPPRGGTLPVVCGVLALGWFGVVVLPTTPWAPVVLVPLLGLCAVVLSRTRPEATLRTRTRTRTGGRARLVGAGALVVTVPLAATAVRALVLAVLAPTVPLQLVLAGALTVGGTVALVVAVVTLLRRPEPRGLPG